MRNIPAELTPLIGREREVAELCELLRADLPQGARLVTLTGPGGAGKTRLALAAAASLAGDFPGSLYFVPLAALSDPALLEMALADGLGLPYRGSLPIAELLANSLAGRPALLVLDCFEHLVATAPLLSELLAAAAGLKLLVTSRNLLHLSAEHNYPVVPLAAPADDSSPYAIAQYPSVQLFVARAAALKPGFALNPDNAPYVAEICRRLDGLPLALELAAARIRLLSPQALLGRLERRLPLLTGGPGDLPERQRTLYDTIDWSYRLLREEERTVFNHLAVFAGGWTLEAAAAVIGSFDDNPWGNDVLDVLTSMADKSLLHQSEGPDGEPRFAMLDTLREYAADKLAACGEEAAARRAHAAYYSALAEAGELGLQGSEQGAWVRRLAAERANFREALGWTARAGEADLAMRLAAAMYPFWTHLGNWAEGINWLQGALALPGGSPRPRARALLALTFLDQPRLAGHLPWLEESRVLAQAAGDRSTEARVLSAMGSICIGKDFAAGLRLEQEGLALARAAGDRWMTAMIAYWLGWDLVSAGHTPERVAQAEAVWRESIALFEACGDRWSRADAQAQLAGLAGVHATDPQQYQAAIRRLEEAVALFRGLEYLAGHLHALVALGEVALWHGDYPRAQHAYEAYVEVRWASGMPPGYSLVPVAVTVVLQGDWQRAAILLREAGGEPDASTALVLGAICLQRGQPDVTAALLAAVEAAQQVHGSTLAPGDQHLFGRALVAAKGQMPEADFSAAWARGQSMTLPEAYAYGQEHLALTPLAIPASAGLALEAGAQPGSIPGSPEALTERELDVLRLVAQGLSNREVAAQLVVSPLTVSAHLRSIYGKLDVNSRTAAARFAIDHRLI